NQSLEIKKSLNDPVALIEVMDNLGEAYLISNNPTQSKSYLTQAETIIRRYGTPEYLRQNLELQIKLASAQHNFKTGMMLMDEPLIIRDSLLNEEKSKSLQAMHIRYETEKKEQQIAMLQQQEEINTARIRTDRILIVSLIAGM